MRLARCLGVSVVATSIAVGGFMVAPAASADCESHNGTMICSDQPSGGSTAPAQSRVTENCDWDWYCDEFGMDYVINKVWE